MNLLGERQTLTHDEGVGKHDECPQTDIGMRKDGVISHRHLCLTVHARKVPITSASFPLHDLHFLRAFRA